MTGELAERMIDVGGVELCTERIGDPKDPAVVLGVGASMLWWEEGTAARTCVPEARPLLVLVSTSPATAGR
jgi:hypothetical protein